MTSPAISYTATITVDKPAEMTNWRPLAQWIFAIPHLLIAGALKYVSGAVAVVSWFIILVTGRLPENLANLQIMIIRYTMRAQLYAGFLYEEYPPFDFTLTAQDPGGSPVNVDFVPDLGDRDRLSVGLRILWAIPAMLFVFLISVVGIVCWTAAFFAVLFTRQWPEGLWSWVMKMNRVSIRFQGYAMMLTDEYPAFSTD